MTAPSSAPSTDPNHGSLSPFVCACFTLNYLIGTGFLTLPWAFEVSGILLSCVTMALTCLVCNVASDYLLASMARADALVVVQEAEANATESKTLLPNASATMFAVEFDSLESVEAKAARRVLQAAEESGTVSPLDASCVTLVQQHGRLLVSERKFELTELVGHVHEY